MPLSIDKLQDFLATKGFMPVRFYLLDDLVFYIEVLSSQSASTFLLYIPSKYEFSMSKGSNVFKIRYVDMEGSSDNTAEEYGGGNVDIASVYGGATIDLSPDRDTKLETHLEDNYRRPISLNDISDEDQTDLKSLYRQMRRLRYCVANIKYKVGIVYKNYICAIRRDDSIDCFSIKHYPRTPSKKLMVIGDLEMFYEKNEKMDEDIQKVRKGIYDILQRNQGYHTRVISKILENKQELTSFAEKSIIRKNRYDANLIRLQKMLATMNLAERKTMAELYELEEKRNDPNRQGMHNDIATAHRKVQLEGELTKISGIKQEIMRNISILRQRREDNVLSVDKIMFDNTVMFDTMVKNFAQLKNFC